ncbi:MAG: ABC transporter ATP-binding protein [Gemmatimonadota bacterium]|nr:ABC transporter ATP-binding protein [Gemmatimonadota bacterium]
MLLVTTRYLVTASKTGDLWQLLHRVPLSDISQIRVEPLIGASGLILTVKGQLLRVLRYSYASAQDMSEAVESLVHLIDKEHGEEDHTSIHEEPAPDWSSRAAHIRTFKRLWSFCKPHKRSLSLAILVTISSSAIDLLPPYLTMIMVDEVLTDPSQYGWLALLVLVLAASRFLHTGVTILSGRMLAVLGDRLAFDARSELFHVLQLLPIKYYDAQQTGGLMARIARDAKSIHYFWIDFAPAVIQQGLLVFGMTAVLFYLNWELAYLVMIPIPAIIFASVKIKTYLTWFYGRSSDSWATFFDRVNDALAGIRVVKIFAQEEKQSAKMQMENEKVFQAERNIHVRSRTVRPLLAFLVSIGGLLVWWFGGQQVQNNEMTLGMLMAFFMYLAMFYGPVQQLTGMADWIPEMMTAITRTFEVIDSPPEEYDPREPVTLPEIKGRIELKDVSFGYVAHQPVLRNLNLTIEPGEMIGLVGHSGAGKSTLVKLLCRFYDIKQGQILIDGIDIRQISLTELRSQIGYVEQDPFLFSGSVADNIRFGNQEASKEKIIEAAINANAHEFVIKLTDGYDTHVGERGGRLSGGERQRIAIARAILHDPRILILDEPTSALDLETEKKIQEALGRLMQGRTTFAIAHRLST